MKTYLYYFATCFATEFCGELLDEAVSRQKEGNKVYFAICGGVNKLCMHNQMGSSPLCSWCKYFTKKNITRHGIKCISVKDYASNIEENDINLGYKTVDDYKKITYRNVNIGMSIMSTYITLTRNMNPKLDNEGHDFFDQHLIQNVRFVDALYNMIDMIKPDEIYSYNGRYEEYRPLYDIGQACGIDTFMIEDYVRVNDGKKYKIFFINSTPHNIDTLRDRIHYCWNHYDLSYEEKIALGRSFFDKRRNGIAAGDKVYTKNQITGQLPIIDSSKINVAIMNSSEDECAAVGVEYDRLKMFNNQIEGIKYILSNSPSNIHFYLRIHPNLAKIPYKYHHVLFDLEKIYSNLTVIPGDSQISSYSLLDAVDIIVGFGTTMNIEASYWGKPSILLGPAPYMYDNVCYTPKRKDDIIPLLNKGLKPLWNENILKYGAYFLNQDPLTIDLDCQYRYVNFNYRSRRFIKKFTSVPYNNFIINEYITGLVINIGRVLLGNHFKSIPTAESAE